MKKIKTDNVVKFPTSISDGEKEIEAILFASSEPLDEENIETKISKKINVKKALENLESILTVPQLDAIIIGPYDLSASMGKAGQLDDKEVSEAIDKIVKKSIDLGVSCGIHIIEPSIRELDSRIKEGFNFIAYSLDIRMLSHNAKEALEQIK